MIKRSPFCSLDNTWFIVSNHGTSEIRQSSLTSLKVWTVFLLVLPILFLTTFKLEPNHFETVQEVENVNVPNIIALEPANIISLFFNCFVLTIPVVQPPQLCCLVCAPSVGKNNSMGGKKTVLVCCEERARRSRLSSNQTFGDLGKGKKGEAEAARPYQSFGQRQSLGHCGHGNSKQQLKVAFFTVCINWTTTI